MIERYMTVLQNHTKLEKEVQFPCGETYPTSHEESHAISVKVEAVSDAEEEEEPLPITFPKIKAEPEVRCMSLYGHCRADLETAEMRVAFVVPVLMFLNMEELYTIDRSWRSFV
jgi:hypothetical protein